MIQYVIRSTFPSIFMKFLDTYEGWNFNSGNYLLVFTTDTK